MNKNHIECKTGNFYCQRLLEHLKIKNVLRISLLHYNSIEELEKFFYLLEQFKKNLDCNYDYAHLFAFSVSWHCMEKIVCSRHFTFMVYIVPYSVLGIFCEVRRA